MGELHPWELLVGLRYLRARRREAFVSLIAMIAGLGVAIGVMTLCIVLAVMTGFEEDLRERILGFNPQIVVMSHGGPVRDVETVEQTLELMEELRPTAVIAFTGIRVLPGTGMVDIALRERQIDPDDNLLHPKFYVSQTLGDDLVARIERHAATHSNWIVPGRGIRTNIEMLRKLRDKKIKGQLWRLLR